MKRIVSIVNMLLLALLIVSASGSYYFYNQVSILNSQIASLKENPQQAADQERKELVNKVSQLILLPEGEDPTVATVQDPELLKDQPFFAKAKKGDKVLIYTQAKKAFLYDPINNRILDVAPLNIGEKAAGEQPTERKQK